MSDVLLWANQRGLYLNVELKSEGIDADALLDAVEKDVSVYTADPLMPSLLFSSFAVPIIRSARHRGWAWPLAQLLNKNDAFAFDDDASAQVGVHPHVALLDDSRLTQWLPARAFLNTWTVNAPDDARRLALAGVDGFISDDPVAIRNALE